MKQERWMRIIPVALIMYTISYIDRTNVALALDPKLSTLMQDLLMDDKMKGHIAGIFFLGYVLLQIPGGHFAHRWSAKKLVSLLLVLWGIFAVGCGLVTRFPEFNVQLALFKIDFRMTAFRDFELMRFMLGVAESGVFPATLVLLANWFPRNERARANAYWNLCQPLAVAGSAPITGWLIDGWGWQTMLVLEGALPFVWLPIWWHFISDHPREAPWISSEERKYLETTLQREAAELEPVKKTPLWQAFLQPVVFVMLPVYFLQNCAAYGCNTFLTSGFDSAGKTFSGVVKGILFAIPYAVAAIVMILNSWHSDKTRERRGHVALVYSVSGISLLASVWIKPYSFWLSYVFLCLAVPGPFAGLAPFWAIPAETLPRSVLGAVMGLVNAIGNVGGYVGPKIVGILKQETHSMTLPFSVLGVGLLVAAGLCFLLPRSQLQPPAPVSR